MDWHQIKHLLEAGSGLDMDALHVHAGVALQLAAALVLRRPLSSPWPWLAVLAVELGNEYYDWTYEVWPTRDEQFMEGVRDVWNTMLIPTVILVLARWLPAALVGRAGRSGADPGQPGGEAR